MRRSDLARRRIGKVILRFIFLHNTFRNDKKIKIKSKLLKKRNGGTEGNKKLCSSALITRTKATAMICHKSRETAESLRQQHGRAS